ncbi:hypothetical protein [Streptomyces hyaluromycini]|uniref:hypothetical protein n=1 Tax=Streptomyces hyaluromycini TaxID=1377993 RepID=UPI000B5CE743|nr:hypothetical protein [Streptomyces hyaluromycini]
MVTASRPATAAPELLAYVDDLRVDADRMDGYAQRLRGAAETLGNCAEAPEWGGASLERQATACVTAAIQLRAAAAALLVHAAE